MKYPLFILMNLFFISNSISQVHFENDGSLTGQMFTDRQGFEYFKSGIVSFENGNLVRADSLFTLALCTYQNEDVYFNRAHTKILLEDTIGYCSDLRVSAYSYYDTTAAKLFVKTCCNKVDTNYYDKKGLPADNSNYKFLEEVLYLKYEIDTIGFIRHKYMKNNMIIWNYDCGFTSYLMNFRNTDIVGMYYIHSGEKFFLSSSTYPYFRENNEYIDLLNRSKSYLANKYSEIKTSENDEIEVISEFTVDKTGQISDISLAQVIPTIVDEKTSLELENDIIDIIKHFPNLKPGRMFKNSVVYKYYYKIKF